MQNTDKGALVKRLQSAKMFTDTTDMRILSELLTDTIALLAAPAEAPVEVTDDFVRGILVQAGLLHHPFTYAKWKDGIDIEMPTVDALKFAEAVISAAPLPQSAPVSREAVIEECAKVCDTLEASGATRLSGRFIASAIDCAAAIRALPLAAHPAEPVNAPAGKGA